MSTETEFIKQKISIIKKLIELYQSLLRQIAKTPIDVIIHHTATDRDKTSAEAIENNHRKDGYSMSSLGKYTAYNVLIVGNGEIHWTRSLDETGHATSVCKGFHIDLCLTGNFEDEVPLQGQLDALQSILSVIKTKYGIKSLKGHRDYFATLCPGRNLYSWLQDYKKALGVKYPSGV